LVTTQDEYFGSEDQRALLRRGRNMAQLFADDWRYSYYGRTVGLVRPCDGDIEKLAALARIQGNSNYSYVPEDEVEDVKSALEARGLIPMHYARWEGDGLPLERAKEVLQSSPLPDDLQLVRLDADTPGETLASLAEMSLTCGVLPLAGETLRGRLGSAICLAAKDNSGKVVSCAAASTFAHRDHPTLAGQAWWGMLATHPDQRGRKLAVILGAQLIVEMNRQFGLTSFMTGVEQGNAPSEAVCSKMGLQPIDAAILGCADPQTLSSGRMTK
jgi:hypothetical protein